MLTSFLMGFTAGVPFVVVVTLLQAWLKDGGVNLTTIGVLTLVGLPYSLKFLWAPILDYVAPFGQRRHFWLVLSQVWVFSALFGLSLTDPSNISQVAVLAFLVSFGSATQDIVIDAYRREDLLDSELASGSAAYLWGYRLGMVAVSGGGLIAADLLGWTQVFRVIGALMLIGPLTLIFSPEPKVLGELPKTLAASITGPLRDFSQKSHPWLLLGFIFFYKFGEQLISSLNTTFFMEAGYTKVQIGLVVKGFGLASTLAGVSLAGIMVKRYGLNSCLWFFGWFQLANNACLTALWLLPAKYSYLAFFISLDHLVVGAGTTVFVAFLSSQTNISYTATQYALLSSLMALPRSLLSSPSGWLVTQLGWPMFYLIGAALTLPGLIILRALIKRGLAPVPGREGPVSL
ncbi:MAG: MFS transporter [Deltaproteobacteria bacterium]|jgi:PAT family beta-lactamase induction signal transducer AmpG|nr:MFS transporter [Deltaproteobacteria bacterium]